MNSLAFYKYQATGNDFILFDNRNEQKTPSADWITQTCHRRWGVGADGIILLEKHTHADFKMVYYNSDGTQSLCGNGCRAAVSLAAHLKIIEQHAQFFAFDGMHHATVLDDGQIRLKMNDVNTVNPQQEDIFMDTGSPHCIRWVTHLDTYNVVEEGKKIRYNKAVYTNGTNVNFVELLHNNTISIRTYERGVEDETLSCGTGAVAAALATALQGYLSPITVQTKGGILTVEFKMVSSSHFSEIFLTGPAKMVFEGTLTL